MLLGALQAAVVQAGRSPGMSELVLSGIIPPLVTPFLSDGALDIPAFEANLESYSGEDLSGYLVLGSTGEAAALDENEKLQLVQIVKKRAASRTLLVGTGLESTRATIAFTRKVADLGASAALVLTPHFYKAQMTLEALRAHFAAVADASPIPILLYSVPAFTGLSFPPLLAASLASHPNIVGVKESGGDIGLLGRIIASVPPSFAVLCGSGGVIYPALCIGARGGILAVACCAPEASASLFAAFSKGDHSRARLIQDALRTLSIAITSNQGVAALKTAMNLSGLRGGWARSPLLPTTPTAERELQAALRQVEAALA